MSDTTRLRLVGLSILAAFLLFGGGQALMQSGSGWLGLILCLINSVAVVIIGVLIHPVIARTAPRTADIYRAARFAEALLLAISVLALQGLLDVPSISSESFYRLAMIALGLGSIPLCLWLLRTKLVPTALGALGLIGYLCLVAAMVVSALGYETTSLALLLPGTAFEVIFGVLLVAGRMRLRPV